MSFNLRPKKAKTTYSSAYDYLIPDARGFTRRSVTSRLQHCIRHRCKEDLVQQAAVWLHSEPTPLQSPYNCSHAEPADSINDKSLTRLHKIMGYVSIHPSSFAIISRPNLNLIRRHTTGTAAHSQHNGQPHSSKSSKTPSKSSPTLSTPRLGPVASSMSLGSCRLPKALRSMGGRTRTNLPNWTLP